MVVVMLVELWMVQPVLQVTAVISSSGRSYRDLGPVGPYREVFRPSKHRQVWYGMVGVTWLARHLPRMVAGRRRWRGGGARGAGPLRGRGRLRSPPTWYGWMVGWMDGWFDRRVMCIVRPGDPPDPRLRPHHQPRPLQPSSLPAEQVMLWPIRLNLRHCPAQLH